MIPSKTSKLPSLRMGEILVIISFVFLNIFTCGGDPGNDKGPVLLPGDPRLCLRPTDNQILRFETLPGGGWDNLANKERGRVLNVNYTQCKLSDDGLYLIPDGVTIVPVKSSDVETFAELFVHWNDYTSTLSKSINVDAGLHFLNIGISGHFSDEFESVKENQCMEKAATIRVQARYIRYTAHSEPDAPLHPSFRERLKQIAAHLELNQTTMARYESQLLVRDFGTHVVRSVDVGAALEQLDQVSSTFVSQYSSQKSAILASASASFFSVFSFSTSYSQKTSQTMIDQYTSNRVHSKIHTFGGPILAPNNYSVNAWSEGLDDNLVAMDRSGDPIYYVITPKVLTEIPESTVFQVYNYIQDAVQMYYEHNTYRGCTAIDSPNFNFQANVDDGTCKAPFTNYTFGGVYQTCSGWGYTDLCVQRTQKNPITGDYSCPPGYQAVLLQEGSDTASMTRHECYRCWLFFQCCNDNTYYSNAGYQAYWCVAEGQVHQQSGFLFGGVFTGNTINPLTQAKTCPSEFYSLRLLTDLTVCVSDDYELGYRYSIPFAGFYSCKSGNPLVLNERESQGLQANGKLTLTRFMRQSGAASWPHECPKGYSQHLAVVDNGCEINYCVKIGALSGMGLPKIQRPPFIPSPQEVTRNEPVMLSADGTTWKRMNISSWTEMMDKDSNNQGIFKDGVSKGEHELKGDMNNATVVIVSVSATLFCVFVATAVIVKCRKVRYRRRARMFRQVGNENASLIGSEPVFYGTSGDTAGQTSVEISS
ncbi:hypothetical protein CHS0354_032880 [Potamilus streckersoni]|uniref:MACPF domain-containing protein n=1 Tax=Potamilus streckersoni TaxID=2493646 RepID=A0AAE0SME0_9BIVA|nr:hypothetical protein CHS0354_032880 [Potamilus streckersoni]